MVNDKFTRIFSISQNRALGQTLEILQGDFWPTLLEFAGDGVMVGERFRSGLSPDFTVEKVQCTPVAQAPNGKITHILVELRPPALPPTDPPHPLLLADTQPDAAAAAGQIILPRPAAREPAEKAVARPPSQPPVLITPQLVAGLRGLPLPQAARAVGVSATAFKKACRKLGIDRWEFKRGPGRARRRDAAAPRRPATTAAGGGGGGDPPEPVWSDSHSPGPDHDRSSDSAPSTPADPGLARPVGPTGPAAGPGQIGAAVQEILARPWAR
jgi:hypothetical protein